MASIVIEIDIDIRQGNTVRIKETLEQQVVFYWVDVRDSEAVGYGAAGSRAPAGSYDNPHVTGSLDKILYDEEVTWKTHCLHNVKLKYDSFHDFGTWIFTVTLYHSFQG